MRRSAAGRPAGTAPIDWIWLASQSPRRRELLDQIGVRYRLLVPDAHEDTEALEAVRRGEAPLAYVERVTAAKLDAALARLAGRRAAAAPVLCADTTVALGRQILGKPEDAGHAREMLRRLSGRTHRVITSVALGWGGRREQLTQVSTVHFAAWSDADIEAYVASGEPFGKAGGYAIQGRAAARVERIAGSHSSIMGLPLFETARLLERAGVQY